MLQAQQLSLSKKSAPMKFNFDLVVLNELIWKSISEV